MNNSNNQSYLPILDVTRGGIVESTHFGALAIVDASGKLQGSYGDANLVTFLRSSSKPFQALRFIEMDGDLAFGLTDREIAIICASHSGTDDHAAVIRSIQEKVGIQESDLTCGTHPAIDHKTEKAMLLRGEKPTPNRHNCSGKHTGMLAHARLLGMSIEDYINPEHPLQVRLLKAFASMCSLEPEQVVLGVDGCSVPVYGVPLYNAALAFARLCDPSDLAEHRAAACRRIVAAMTANPDMVAGPGRFDTRLMEVAGDRIVTKGGAEGYQGVGLLPGALGPGSPALGITLKISDGDLAGRAGPCVIIEVLRQIGALSPDELEALSDFGPRPVYNWRHIQVGVMQPRVNVQIEWQPGQGTLAIE